MPKKARALDQELQAAVDDYVQLLTHRSVKTARDHPVVTAVKRFSAFLIEDEPTPLKLRAILDAEASDVDRFLETVSARMRTPYRRNLQLMFDHLIKTGRTMTNIVDDAKTWGAVKKRQRPTPMSEGTWTEIVDLFENYTYNTQPWGPAGNIVFLTLARNLELSASDIGGVTAGMARAGQITLPGRKYAVTRSIPIDPESSVAISKYLSALPIVLQDDDILIRQVNELGPAKPDVVLFEIKKRARKAGLDFVLSRIPKPHSDWTIDTEGGEAVLFETFRRIHPRFSAAKAGK